MLIIASAYNVYVNAHFATFGSPKADDLIIDFFVEFLFVLDMIFCFFQEYKDGETYHMVSSFKDIAMHYLKKSFFFDFIAIIPFDLML